MRIGLWIFWHLHSFACQVESAIELFGPPAPPPPPPPHTHILQETEEIQALKKNKKNTTSLRKRGCRLSFPIQLKTHLSWTLEGVIVSAGTSAPPGEFVISYNVTRWWQICNTLRQQRGQMQSRVGVRTLLRLGPKTKHNKTKNSSRKRQGIHFVCLPATCCTWSLSQSEALGG